jgi:hypothetical protein
MTDASEPPHPKLSGTIINDLILNGNQTSPLYAAAARPGPFQDRVPARLCVNAGALDRVNAR